MDMKPYVFVCSFLVRVETLYSIDATDVMHIAVVFHARLLTIIRIGKISAGYYQILIQ